MTMSNKESRENTKELLESEREQSPGKSKSVTIDAKAQNKMNGSVETPHEAETQIKFPPPEVWPEKNFKPKKHSKMKLAGFLDIGLLCGVFQKVCLIFLGYFIATMQWSGIFTILPLTIFTLILYESKLHKSKNKIKAKAKAASSTKDQLMEKLEELPSWVLFPDRERAEWINDIVLQLWPNINSFLVKFVKGKLESKIRKKYDSFKFEDMDFGHTPPKIDGVKVYNRTSTRDSILIDFDVFYDGNCEINFSLSGHQVGRLKDFQLSVQVRVVLKPLMLKAPIVGGIQVFFLNTPEIDFELEGLTGIPGLSHVLRKQIEEKLRKKIVFPNKITKRFTKTVQATELKSLEPEGVLRIHVIEARDLERRDVTGKSDPYVVLTVGAQEYKTAIIKRNLNPKWDEWCEFVILDPVAQQVRLKLFDHDDLNEDDFLGNGVVDIKPIYDGSIDQWITLEGVKHGFLHLRFTWMSLTPDYSTLVKALNETKLLKVDVSSALLTVYIDSARNLPRVKSFKKPDPYLVMQIGNSDQQKSKVKKHTVDPVFEQGFSFLVKNPEEDLFYITIMDKQSNTRIDFFQFEIKELIKENDLEFSMREFPLKSGGRETSITASMQLRVLTSESFSNEESSSESASDYDLSRNESTKSRNSANHSPIPETPKDVEPPITSDMVQKLNSSPLKSPKLKRLNLLNHRPTSTDSDGDTTSGRLHIGLQYSERRQKLLVTVFSMSNLHVKDPKDTPDPYVKIKLFSATSIVRHKTKTIMDNPNPDFNETFEYLISPFELLEQKLLFTIKTKKKLFANNLLGQVLIDFKNLNHLELNEHHNQWYDLQHVTLPE